MGLVEESSDVASAVSISQSDASAGNSTSSPSRSNGPPEVPETSPASPAVDTPAMAPIHTSTSHSASSSSASSSSSFGPMAAPLAPPCNFDDQNDDESHSEHSNDQLDRTIRFPPAAQLTTYHPGADIAELAAYRSQIWYQYDELKHMKRTALALAKDAQRGLGALLTHTYGRAQSTETQTALTTWTTHPQSRRGLERWMNDEYAAKRSDIRKRTIQSVIRAQAKLMEQQQQHNSSNSSTSNHNSQSSVPSSQSSSHSDDDYSIKVLSRLSEAFSVDSRQFAQGMGLADQVAAQQAMQETDDTPLKNSKMQTFDHHHPSSPLSPRRRLSVNSSTSTAHKASLSSSSSSSHATLPSKRGVPKPPRRPGGRGGRSMGITAPSVSADFRHYY